MSIPKPTPVHGAQNPAEAVLPVFPPELEREIFLLTARTYRGVSTRLMLVASRVKAWIEPFVYNIVFLRVPKHAFDFLGALMNHRSPGFVQSHVKALCIFPSIPLRVTIQLLATCSGLESLALWILPQSDNADLINVLSSLPLTFLSLNLASILPPSYWKLGLQNHPVFINLTHLDIVNNWVLWTSSLGIQHLPFLTHVAFRFWSRGSVNGALSKILQESHKLEALVLLANSVAIPGAREYLEKQNVRDIRVVVLQHARDTDEWELMRKGAISMWQRADVIVRWRRRYRAGPFDFPPGFSFGCAEDVSRYTL
ncbi:hypothetical protein JVT61DRAFT_14737 [Boletus reticuloceps]|uniref:Uncharacterized protein n=1 Tax=Boletus reticuloceps TaxID=495285 RepID=A0A8I2YRS7_9AGAM|nr:hypothetical protein JVT61DRAFT_14737 [Boletus reticuloceps]